MRIHSQYFLSKQFAAFLLEAPVAEIGDCYLVNLRDRYGFDESELVDAYERQISLVEMYEAEYTSTLDEDDDLDEVALGDYIIAEMTK